MNADINFLVNELIGTKVPKPLSGTLSGHAAGEPFDKHVYTIIKKHFPNSTFRQFEYINSLYSKNSNATTTEERLSLIPDEHLRLLLNRGKESTKKWSIETQFEEKQDDTADIIIEKNGFINIIDVKTFNMDKNGQPPNIISAYKIAQMCAYMLRDKKFDTHDITYIGISWKIEDDYLVCKGVSIKQLFKTKPKDLYINWAAAMQIQFHVDKLTQNFEGSTRDWCESYLKRFVIQANDRSDKMKERFVKPYIKYIE